MEGRGDMEGKSGEPEQNQWPRKKSALPVTTQENLGEEEAEVRRMHPPQKPLEMLQHEIKLQKPKLLTTTGQK